MIFTIAEVSKLIGLSKVSIYKKLKLKELEPYLSKERGVTYINEIGFNLIKESLNLNDEIKTKIESKEINDENTTDTEGFNIKSDYIKTLKDQLKEKDCQIRELTIALSKAQELHQNTQILLRNQQEQPLLLEQHIKELDYKLIRVKENMQERKAQYETTKMHTPRFKNIFSK